MTKIGVYDSGIGGLTTLNAIMQRINDCEFLYYADNLHMPYGNKTEDEICEYVEQNLAVLRSNCDVCVVACNTASLIANPTNSYHLTPPNLKSLGTMIMATNATISKIESQIRDYVCENTDDLAYLIEQESDTCYQRNAWTNFIDNSVLIDYLTARMNPHNGVIDSLILGCSHYSYLKPLLARLYPSVVTLDGNDALAERIVKDVENSRAKKRQPTLRFDSVEIETTRTVESKVKFLFSGKNERDKYAWLLSRLAMSNDQRLALT